MNNRFNRREFLVGAIAGSIAVPTIIPSSALGKAGEIAPSNKIVMGCIGLGIRGNRNARQFIRENDVRIVAACDVFGRQRDPAREFVDSYYENKDCSDYNDFRELIAREDIDAVSLAVPDHWHVLIGLAAAKAGKDMYFEKPVGVSLEQAQALRKAVHEHNTVFQFGTQQRSSYDFRFACELVRNGKIGELKTIYVGAPASWAIPQDPIVPVPNDLDYDMWLGPAPKVPYSYQRCRPHNREEGYSTWYHIYDYCLGFIANWGVHHLDIAQWGNGSDDTTPIEVEGSGEFPKEGIANCCTKWDLEFLYKNGVKMVYTDNQGRAKQGVRFEGEDGWVHVNRSTLEAEPKSLLDVEIGPNEIRLPKSDNHYRNFLDAVKTRKTPISPIDTAVHSDTLCQLSNIATRLGRKLRWDPEHERFVDDEEANEMLLRPMREPWTLEEFI